MLLIAYLQAKARGPQLLHVWTLHDSYIENHSDWWFSSAATWKKSSMLRNSSECDWIISKVLDRYANSIVNRPDESIFGCRCLMSYSIMKRLDCKSWVTWLISFCFFYVVCFFVDPKSRLTNPVTRNCLEFTSGEIVTVLVDVLVFLINFTLWTLEKNNFHNVIRYYLKNYSKFLNINKKKN